MSSADKLSILVRVTATARFAVLAGAPLGLETTMNEKNPAFGQTRLQFDLCGRVARRCQGRAAT